MRSMFGFINERERERDKKEERKRENMLQKQQLKYADNNHINILAPYFYLHVKKVIFF